MSRDTFRPEKVQKMQARVARRTSFGSTTSLRRSSVSSKDIAAIQEALRKQQKLSPQLLLFVLSAFPFITFFYLYSVHMHGGRFFETCSWVFGHWPFILQIIPPVLDPVAWKVVVVIVSLQILFHLVLPHDEITVLSSAGEQKRLVNSFSSLVLLLLLFLLGVGLRLYPPDVIIVHFNSIIIVLAILCLLTFLILYVVYYFGENYNITTLPELCFGVELAPTFLEIDLKHFARFGIGFSLCALFALSALLPVFTTGKILRSLACLSILQLLYIFRRTWQEQLELNSLDAAVHNLGILRLWSDMVWLPVLFTSPIIIVLHTGRTISLLPCLFIAAVSIFFIYFTGHIDNQKFEFRKAKGTLKIKGVDAYFITAKYKNDAGDSAYNLLLGSGYWAYCRHPNYLSEIVTYLTFCALQGRSPIFTYFPLLFTAGYLFIRMLSDENRCLLKYGQYWIQHTARVPFRLIPGLY